MTSARRQPALSGLVLILTLLLFSGDLLAGGVDITQNSYVKLHVEIPKASYRPGDQGDLRITFYPVEGIHINTAPPVEFRLDSTSSVRLEGSLRVVTDAKTGYMAAGSSAVQRFVVPMASGPLVLRGTIIYFYCSDTEGWCVRFRQPVDLLLSPAEEQH